MRVARAFRLPIIRRPDRACAVRLHAPNRARRGGAAADPRHMAYGSPHFVCRPRRALPVPAVAAVPVRRAVAAPMLVPPPTPRRCRSPTTRPIISMPATGCASSSTARKASPTPMRSDAGGTITMPLIGAVRARGRRRQGLAAEIAAQLRNGFIREPSVAVEIEAYRPFFILGEVAGPRPISLRAQHDGRERGRHRRRFSPRAKRDRVTLTHTDAARHARAPSVVAGPAPRSARG